MFSISWITQNEYLTGTKQVLAFAPRVGRFLGPKTWRNIYKVSQGNEKETMLLVYTAFGETLTPMIVYPYVKPPKSLLAQINPDWTLGLSKSVWMRADV